MCGSTRDVRFDAFSAANVMDWPRTVGELRGEAALAEATIGELAEHLNASLRGDLAALLGDCAHFALAEDDHGGRRAEILDTVWDRFCADSGLYDVDVQEAAAAIAAGPARWDALDEWTPAGGVDGDPYTVCRYAWGPMRARVQLTAAELLAAYLAGDAELTLHRIVIDYGDGPTEFIWPDQPRTCCGQQSGYKGSWRVSARHVGELRVDAPIWPLSAVCGRRCWRFRRRQRGGTRLALRVAVCRRGEASGVGPLAGGVRAPGAVRAALGLWRALCRCGGQARCPRAAMSVVFRSACVCLRGGRWR